MSRLDQTEDPTWVDEDGYPTEAALTRLEQWPVTDAEGAFIFLRAIWWAAEWGFDVRERAHSWRYHVSTAGWSGNEDAVRALERNEALWRLALVSVRRGGHYVFEIPRAKRG